MSATIATGCADGSIRRSQFQEYSQRSANPGRIVEIPIGDFELQDYWIDGLDDEPYKNIVLPAVGALSHGIEWRESIYIADGTNSNIGVMRDGQAVDTILGRRGAGPGEFQSPRWLGICDDSAITAYDIALATLTRYASDGKLQTVERVTNRGDLPSSGTIACNTTGDIAMIVATLRPDNLAMGPFRPRVTIGVRTQDALDFVPVANVPGPDSYRWERQIGPLGEFGRQPSIALTDSTLLMSTGDALEVGEYSYSGRLLRVLQINGVARVPIPDEEVYRVWREQIAQTDSRFHRRLRKTMADMMWPRYYPVLERIYLDPVGCLWLKPYQRHMEPAIWYILTLSGSAVGRARFPAGFRLHSISANNVIGRSLAEFDVPRLAVYRIDRSTLQGCSN